MSPPIAYARSGDVNIAYDVMGDGPLDLVVIHGFFSHLEIDLELPAFAHFHERLASFARVIRFDKRGRGSPTAGSDFRTSRRAWTTSAPSWTPSGASRQHSSATRKAGRCQSCSRRRTRSGCAGLVLYGTYAKRCNPDDDYPWAPTWEQRVDAAREFEKTWGENVDLSGMWPNADPSEAAWFQRRGRAGLSPAGVRDFILMNSKADIRDVLPSVQCPTLVLHRTGDLDASVDEGRYIAARVPGARFVELPGDDHVPFDDLDQILDEAEEFLTGSRPASQSNRVLATTLFTDLVGSTETARALGDASWAKALDAHNAAVRRELARYSGEEIDTAGDGFLALFDGPARAIRCGLAIRDALGPLALDVRAGVHTGEVERPAGDKPRGIAVHVGARIMSLAGAGEVLVSSTTHDLVAGSGLEFEDRGEHVLKGIEGPRRLYAAL